MSRYEVLVVGGAGVDTVVRVDSLQIPVGDSLFVPPVTDWVAHTGSGVALGLHTLGRSVKFLDFLGDDPQAALILQEFAGRGLDFSHVVSPTGTPRAVNLVDRAGRRFSFYDGRHPEGLRLPRDFWLPHLERSGHVHLCITGVNRDLYPDVHRLGVSSSTDLHDWDGRNPHHRHYAVNSDLVFLSVAGISGRHGEVMRSILAEGRARLVVATAGADGSYLLTRDHDEIRHFPAIAPDRPVVDSNGAGDAFVSGFLDSWLAGQPAERSMVAGALCGAHACTSEGVITDLIDAAGLAAALARSGAATG